MNNNQNEHNKSGPPETPQGYSLQTLSIVSGLFWLIIGAIFIHFFQERTIADSLTDGAFVWIQMFTGIGFGILFGVMGVHIIKHPGLQSAMDDYQIIKVIKKLNLSPWQVLSVSLVAGITEEFLFRAAVQPIIGIWITSLIFIGVHGYIRLATVPQFLFTLFTFLLSMMLGYLYIAFGIYSAMAAHVVYDVIVLWYITKKL